MWDKLEQLKQLNELRKKQNVMKQALTEESVEVEVGEIKIVIRGDQEVESVFVDGQEDGRLKRAFNKAIKESQKLAFKKMKDEFGSTLGIPGF